MIIFTLKGYEEVRDYLRMMPAYLYEDVKYVFTQSTERVRKNVVSRLNGYPLNSRSGALASSIKTSVTGTNIATLTASVYSNSPYASVHEKGATITAKNRYRWLRGGPYMNFPTMNNYGANGKPIMTSRQLFSVGGRVKYGSNGFGVYLGATKMFNLAKTVKVPARLGLREEGVKDIPTVLNSLQLILLEDRD